MKEKTNHVGADAGVLACLSLQHRTLCRGVIKVVANERH